MSWIRQRNAYRPEPRSTRIGAGGARAEAGHFGVDRAVGRVDQVHLGARRCRSCGSGRSASRRVTCCQPVPHAPVDTVMTLPGRGWLPHPDSPAASSRPPAPARPAGGPARRVAGGPAPGAPALAGQRSGELTAGTRGPHVSGHLTPSARVRDWDAKSIGRIAGQHGTSWPGPGPAATFTAHSADVAPSAVRRPSAARPTRHAAGGTPRRYPGGRDREYARQLAEATDWRRRTLAAPGVPGRRRSR